MTIRVLCLHGMGTDGTFFREQMKHIQRLLPTNYAFTFIDGPVPCDPTPQLADFYAGPSKCWYNTPTSKKVAAAHRHIRKILDRTGGSPFDIVIGFSQGAALAASMLLQQQLEEPDEQPLWKAAMFICSPLPFATTPHHGVDLRGHFGIASTPALPVPRPTRLADHLVADPYFLRNEIDLGEECHATAAGSEGGGPYYNMFHPSADVVRIRIPTAHVYGKKDSWRMHSWELMRLCDRSNVVQFEHYGDHEVPQDASEEICDLFEELVARAGLW